MDWQSHSRYKWTDKTESKAEQVCYCCGLPGVQVVDAVGFPGAAKIGLCMFCADGQFLHKNGYLVYDCPSCGSADIKGMVDYWRELAKYNEKYDTKKTGKRVNNNVNWKKERTRLINM